MAMLWHCMWARGPKGNNATCSALSWLSVTSPTTHKQIGPFWCWFLGGWFWVHSRTLWVSPMNFPVRLGVSTTAATPTDFYSQRFWGFLFPWWNHGLHNLSCSPVVPPGLSTRKYGTTHSSSCLLVQSDSHCLTHPNPPVTSLPCILSSLAAHLHSSYWSGWMFLL